MPRKKWDHCDPVNNAGQSRVIQKSLRMMVVISKIFAPPRTLEEYQHMMTPMKKSLPSKAKLDRVIMGSSQRFGILRLSYCPRISP